MAQDRRRFQRVALDMPAPAILDESENGVVFDLCEDGFAVSELGARKPGELVPFSFDLPEGSGRIRGRAEIIWKSESGHRAGLHFVELGEPSRQRLVQWISARAWTMRLDGMETNYPEPADATRVVTQIAADSAPANEVTKTNDGWALPPISPTLGAEFEPNEADLVAGASTPSAGSTRAVGIALAVVLLASGLGFLVSSSRGMHAKAQPKDSLPSQLPTTSAQELAVPPSAAPATERPTTTESATPAAQPNRSGFVLQVGAMTHEDYADALVKNLRQKNLPAFVFRREGDDFYRVAVGPYRDTDSSTKVKDTLEKQGLKPFVKTWASDQK